MALILASGGGEVSTDNVVYGHGSMSKSYGESAFTMSTTIDLSAYNVSKVLAFSIMGNPTSGSRYAKSQLLNGDSYAELEVNTWGNTITVTWTLNNGVLNITYTQSTASYIDGTMNIDVICV